MSTSRMLTTIMLLLLILMMTNGIAAEEISQTSKQRLGLDLLDGGRIKDVTTGQEIKFGARSATLNLLGHNTNDHGQNSIYLYLEEFGIDKNEFLSLFRFIIISFLIINISCLWCFKCIKNNQKYQNYQTIDYETYHHDHKNNDNLICENM